MEIGLFKATVLRHAFVTSGSGTPGLRIQFAVNFPSGEEPMPYTVWMSDKSMNIARRALKTLGFDVDKDDMEDLYGNEHHLAGKIAEVLVDEETYQGKTSLKIKQLSAPNVKPDLKKLQAKLKAAKKDDDGDDSPPPPKTEAKKSNTIKQAVESKEPNGDPDGSSIPF